MLSLALLFLTLVEHRHFCIGPGVIASSTVLDMKDLKERYDKE